LCNSSICTPGSSFGQKEIVGNDTWELNRYDIRFDCGLVKYFVKHLYPRTATKVEQPIKKTNETKIFSELINLGSIFMFCQRKSNFSFWVLFYFFYHIEFKKNLVLSQERAAKWTNSSSFS
jgi:hypothetical protein